MSATETATGDDWPVGDVPKIADEERLIAWLDTQGLGVGAPLEHHYISGGSQNEIYELRRGDLHCAMRIPPPSAPAPRDEGIVREWRIIEALGGTDVPHTEAIALCTDQSVLGRTFYLMGFVDGWSPMSTRRQWPAPFDTDLGERRGLAFQLIEGIALLSKVDWQAKGLSDLGRPDGFHERQVDRWTAFLERIKGRELPGFDEAAAWLRAHRPIDYVPGLMHGDYQFANVMFRDGAPARLAAIVDWEMGTVGDPKLDLGWVVHSWPDDTTDDEDRVRRLRRHDRHAVARRDPGALREGVGPPGRRHRLLLRAGQVEARRRARAGLPAARRRREAAGVRADRARAHAVRGRTRRDDRLRGARRLLTCAPPCAACTAAPTWSRSPTSRRRSSRRATARVRVHVGAVNFPDVLVIANTYQMPAPLPFIPGSEFAGEVIEVADGVTAVAVGDRVFGSVFIGAFADEVVVSASSLARIPDGVDDVTAAAFGVAYRTAYHVLRSVAELAPGDELVVLGAGGGVGTAAVQLGALLGATVTAVASSDEKLEVAKALRGHAPHQPPRGRPAPGAARGAARRGRRRGRPGGGRPVRAGPARGALGRPLRHRRVRLGDDPPDTS